MNSRLLIVDDNRELTLAYKWLLEPEGFHVDVASRGEEALQVLSRDVFPDLVLIDYKMPGMNGLELVREIRARHGASVPADRVVVLTSFSPDSPQLAGLRAEGVPFAEKPGDLVSLLPLLQRFLGSSPRSAQKG